MKTMDVIVVRIYIMESSHLLNKIVNYLKTEANIRGVSVFRAISGFGETGNHSASLVDLSLDLPLIIEFFGLDRRSDHRYIMQPSVEPPFVGQVLKQMASFS